MANITAATLAAIILANPKYTGGEPQQVAHGISPTGYITPFNTDANGNLATTASGGAPAISATNSPSLSTSFASVASAQAKATPAQLVSIRATNANAAVRYLQLFNAASATGTPIYSEPIPAGSATQPSSLILDSVFFGSGGKYFSTALSWGISTTNGSYTAATAADHNVSLHFF